jgi:hypothetical protein
VGQRGWIKKPWNASNHFKYDTIQVYSSDELEDILKEHGSVVCAQTDINGLAFSKED